ncbi:hypothetical protein L6654_41690 [Bradyrhizobium sp. WYCCWR 13023]|uniref:Uncharacterized protein n=1 Tax=Bradyrhizobium zhengyangense TaxID=2911009 RepID=A0A9X1RHY9_9BRAD|nr:hypothetical protein [Bradyrhizobium zhengyangense]MCG2633066.1 hypothetical protein [Bradyrhizobium zhengyangense]
MNGIQFCEYPYPSGACISNLAFPALRFRVQAAAIADNPIALISKLSFPCQSDVQPSLN